MDGATRDAEHLYAEELWTRYLEPHGPSAKRGVLLEIGAGGGGTAAVLSQYTTVIALDLSLDACRVIQQRTHGHRVWTVCGDIHHLPFRGSVCDVVYGGGVVEHFRDTVAVLRELRRVCRPGGTLFQTVPRVSLPVLTVGQLWGNIPDLPGVRSIASWIHFRLLSGRHLRFGLEKSFLQRNLRRMAGEVGFDRIQTGVFHIYHSFSYVTSPLLRTLMNVVIRIPGMNHHIYLRARRPE